MSGDQPTLGKSAERELGIDLPAEQDPGPPESSVSIHQAIETLPDQDESAQVLSYVLVGSLVERASRDAITNKRPSKATVLDVPAHLAEDQLLSTFCEIAFMRRDFDTLERMPVPVQLLDTLKAHNGFKGLGNNGIGHYLGAIRAIKRRFREHDYAFTNREDVAKRDDVRFFDQTFRVGLEKVFAQIAAPHIAAGTHLPPDTNPRLARDFLEPAFIAQAWPGRVGSELPLVKDRDRPSRALRDEHFVLWGIDEHKHWDRELRKHAPKIGQSSLQHLQLDVPKIPTIGG